MLILLSALAGTGLRMLAERYDGNVLRQLLLDPDARREHSNISGPLNFLLIGSDQFSSARPDNIPRADTIMIAHLPAELTRAYLISVPRDLLVQIPASAATGYPGGTDKVNAAFHHGGGDQGGAQLLSATLTRLTGIRFDGAALIDFSGFRRVVDLLGGVEICVDRRFQSVHSGTVFEPGCQHMDGARALDFARQRYDLPGGDFDRQRHQQQLLRAMLDKAGKSSLLSNPGKLDQLIRAIGSSIVADTNGMPLDELVFALRGVRSDALAGVRLPAHPEEGADLSYVVLDEPAYDLFAAVRRADLPRWATANPGWVNQL